MNHPPFMGAEGPKTPDFGCIQRTVVRCKKGMPVATNVFLCQTTALALPWHQAATPRQTTGFRLSHQSYR
jgi:hypothetical protein